MRISALSVYVTRQILFAVGGLFFALVGLIFLVDFLESLRFVEKVPNAGLTQALVITGLHIPKLSMAMVPFVILFGSMMAFYQLNRRSELAVMRSAGISVWGIIGPGALVAILLGIGIVTIFDPLASQMDAKSETYKNQIRGKTASLLKSLQGGIWLRQKDGMTTVILHAEKYDPEKNLLQDVTIWRRNLDGAFIERWDADIAFIRDQGFELQRARRTTIGQTGSEIKNTEWVPSAFSIRDLREDIARPEAMSIWQLPRFIALSTDAGLPNIDYRLRYHELWSMPLKLLGMVLIAAAFTMRPVRGGGTAKLILAGVGAGFLLFIISEFSTATAEARMIPVALAAWTPVLLALSLALTLLIYREDG